MTPDATAYGQDNLGVFGYGSLLADAGSNIERHVMARIPQQSPWGIEYARSSTGRFDAPTLVIHRRGSPVTGQVLVLDLGGEHVQLVRGWLRTREGNPPLARIKFAALAGLSRVLYADLACNIPDDKLNAEHLASLAIASVPRAGERNGIRYLADNIGHGVMTPLTNAYRDAILRLTGAETLADAERIARRGI